MPEVLDTFSFDRGINTKKNPTLLEDGELQACEGFAFSNDGYLSVMTPRRQVPHSPYGEIRNLHRYQNFLIMQEGSNIRFKWDLTKFCDLYIPPDKEFTDIGNISPYRCRIIDYKSWSFIVNKGDNKVFGNATIYDWGVDNPTTAPFGIGGTAYNEGTTLGDMTGGGGIAAAFDGNTSQTSGNGAAKSASNNITGYVGKDWGAGVTKTITEFQVYGSTDYGLTTSAAHTGGSNSGLTLKLQGSTDNFVTSVVDLYTESSIINQAGIVIQIYSGIDVTTAYRYHRIYLQETEGGSEAHSICIAEVDFTKNKPNGGYDLYYTFMIYFPNGEVYETAPSPKTTVNVSYKDINWSGIGTSNYNSTGAVIHRRLYRYSPELGAIFFVDEIGDNTTTTYTDSKADYDIDVNATLSTIGYGKPPTGIIDLELYLQRIFIIKDNYLYWSEPYNPFAFKNTSAIAVTSPGDNLKSIVFWGDTLYVASESAWYRLVGSDPDTWLIKKTFSDAGIINTDTVKRTKYGIPGLWHDGIYLFDGSTSRKITDKKLDDTIFTNTINTTKPSTELCYASMDSTKYYFYYSTDGTTLDSCFVMDFAKYPEIRIYDDPFIATAHEYDFLTGKRYIARIDT